MSIESLKSRERLEEAVEKVQRSCLAGMLRVSMDRVTYAPLGQESLAPGEEKALQEIQQLEDSPKVICYRHFCPYL